MFHVYLHKHGELLFCDHSKESAISKVPQAQHMCAHCAARRRQKGRGQGAHPGPRRWHHWTSLSGLAGFVTGVTRHLQFPAGGLNSTDLLILCCRTGPKNLYIALCPTEHWQHGNSNFWTRCVTPCHLRTCLPEWQTHRNSWKITLFPVLSKNWNLICWNT